MRVRHDGLRVARNREPGVTIEQIAKDFGDHPMTLKKWLRRADIDEGTKPGQSRTEAAKILKLRKRNRMLEQENEVLRRRVSQANLRGKVAAAHDGARPAEIPVTPTRRVLKLFRQPYR